MLLTRLLRTHIIRTVLAVGVGGALVVSAAGCSSASGGDSASASNGLTSLTLQTSWIPLVQFGGSYVAAHEGYYKGSGVDVDILPGGPNVDASAAVASGKADIAMANADTIARANQHGADLVII
ncbi:MAG: ABC transporter substrate-binding protein, partial [Gordonia sp. (in: high G+C Gram-positive bacteria)]